MSGAAALVSGLTRGGRGHGHGTGTVVKGMAPPQGSNSVSALCSFGTFLNLSLADFLSVKWGYKLQLPLRVITVVMRFK